MRHLPGFRASDKEFTLKYKRKGNVLSDIIIYYSELFRAIVVHNTMLNVGHKCFTSDEKIKNIY